MYCTDYLKLAIAPTTTMDVNDAQELLSRGWQAASSMACRGASAAARGVRAGATYVHSCDVPSRMDELLDTAYTRLSVRRMRPS